MRVITGRFRGRTIPFNVRRYGDASVTPDMIKEALFSVLGADLSGGSFLDLFACSGQVGLEALSRGCTTVVFNEKDRRRYEFIRGVLEDWGEDGEGVLVLNFPASRCMRLVHTRGMSFDCVFLDPPYEKVRGAPRLYGALLAEIGRYELLAPGGLAVVQHYVHNSMEETAGTLRLLERRVYGTNALAFYGHAERDAPVTPRAPGT
ncbi:MAG TPA: RsmD family RNA methyltransferase [Spirochaetota bacterium]|nr:RsmD family RNA methyltransferase [Spirochaetota bacterium]HPV97470.1 RsmD family RNA methyltransferase [Spirochaetota bacterium]